MYGGEVSVFCSFCGARLPDKAVFCPSCGERIAAAPSVGASGKLSEGGVPTMCEKCGSPRLKRLRFGEYQCEYCGSRFFTGPKVAESPEDADARLEALFAEANAFAAKNDYHEELRVLTGGLSFAPESTELMLHLGRVHRRLGNPKKAMAYYKEAERLNPSDPLVYANQGALFITQGLYAEARHLCEKALAMIKADPLSACTGDVAVAYANYALCLGELGDLAGAKKYLAMARSKGYGKESLNRICKRLNLDPADL